MEPERIYLAGFLAFAFIVLTVVLIAVDWAAANGRLQRNQWAGIRTPSTMRSDQAWVAGSATRSALKTSATTLPFRSSASRAES
jgi:hypothetical protein